jgi:hypothetical protein
MDAERHMLRDFRSVLPSSADARAPHGVESGVQLDMAANTRRLWTSSKWHGLAREEMLRDDIGARAREGE